MNNQILYDKVISVTLYAPPQVSVAKYTTQVVEGYGETTIDNQKVLYNYSATTKKYIPVAGKTPVSTGIEFYEGAVYRVFMGYTTDQNGQEKAIYKKIRSSGSVYFLDTLEQMKTGRTSSGNVFKTGDRIRIKENNSTWTAVVKEGFQGYKAVTKVVGEETIKEDAETLVLDCTTMGIKPDMSLSINLLPGQNCYNAILKVRNLNLESKDIRKWTRMVITAGYRTGYTATYTCPIFASYIEEPNPDGITVFEGITVGVAEDILNNRYTEIHFIAERMRLIDLTEQVAKGISAGITVECAIDDEIMNREITMSKQVVYAQNGAAILSWLQTTISQFIQNISDDLQGEKMSAFIQLVDNKLQIIALNGPNKKPEVIENIISLDMVSGATFNGTALTVVAPWNPALQPGNLFYMPPEFINGSKLPNVLPTEDYRNDDNLYRTLTMAVNFASVEKTNKMEILAVPAQWAGQIPSERTTSMRADTLAQTLAKDANIENIIQVGKEEAEVGQINQAEPIETTGRETFDKNEGIIGAWGTWGSLDINGRCLSELLDYYLFDDPSGPHLQAYQKGTNIQSAYYVSRDDLADNSYALLHFQTGGCKANVLWWPLTMVGTYWIKKKSDKEMYMKLKAVKDIWYWAYKEYREIYGPLSSMWRSMYYYLGGDKHDIE